MSKVLYVEDNPQNMRLVRKLLNHVGINMVEAIDGFSGIDIAHEEQPHVILIDVNLPDIDGLEVTRRLKESGKFADIPIIALTANAMHGDRELCLDAGCDAYLAKPVARQELYNTLRTFIPDAFAVVAAG